MLILSYESASCQKMGQQPFPGNDVLPASATLQRDCLEVDADDMRLMWAYALCRYIPTVKGGEFLRALRRCVSPIGDRTQHILNSMVCPSTSSTVDKILGYVR